MAGTIEPSLYPILADDTKCTVLDGTEDRDPNKVDWDGPYDRENPHNWPKWRKLTNIAMVTAMSFNVPLASSILAPAVPQVLHDFGTTSPSLATFVVSVYVLGLGSGPLVLAPMSELYGRVIVYHILNMCFIIFTVGCALSSNMSMLIAFRFLAGLVGGGPISIGAGSIADMTSPQERGTAMSIWSLGPLLGPCIGPVVGGFVSKAADWRWVFWTIAIIATIISIACLAMLHETNAPTLLEKRARRTRKITGNKRLRSSLRLDLAPKDLFIGSIVRPSKLFSLSPICFLLSLYSAFVYAVCYLLISTFTFVFEDMYNFTQDAVGLVFIALGGGFVAGLSIQQLWGATIILWLTRRYKREEPEPEYRLATTGLAAILIPAGLLLYGWTAEQRVHWSVPLLGTAVAAIGIIIVFIVVNSYLIDIFPVYAASALAATTVLRCIFGATFPLFGLDLYQTLGLGWGNSVLAFLALALMWPIQWLIFVYGKLLRTHPKCQIKL